MNTNPISLVYLVCSISILLPYIGVDLARGFSQDAWEPPHPRRLGMLLSKYPPLNMTKRSMLTNPHKCHATNIFEETSSFESRIWNQNVNQMCRAENCPTSTYDALWYCFDTDEDEKPFQYCGGRSLSPDFPIYPGEQDSSPAPMSGEGLQGSPGSGY